MNKNLEVRVNEQTKDLQTKNTELERILTIQSEFLDISSHQLRTLISVIKGMPSMFVAGEYH